MVGTIPSATAWSARSSRDQWVMCSPRANGSKQANATIWARWRGGNRGVSPRSLAASIGEQPRHAVASITLAGPPDRGLFALHLGSDGLGPLASRDRQDDPRPLHLEPRGGLTVSEL